MLIPAKFVKVVTPLALAISLAACGGAGSFGDGQSGDTNNPTNPDNGGKAQHSQTASSIALVPSSTQVLADGSAPVRITAIVKNKSNVAIDNEVEFSVDKNATLVVEGKVATLTPNDSGLGALTVTATSGEISKTITIDVIETVTQAESDIKLGSSSGDTFKVGQLEIIDDNLDAGGKTSISVSLVDSKNKNALVSSETPVIFTSTCASKEWAKFSDVRLNAGIATVDYEATGCSGVDTITATAIVDGVAIKASSDITVKKAVIGSLEYNEAKPSNIGLKGMGLNEVSTVTFTARDVSGNPVINQEVEFSLSTQTGGITLTSDKAKTDANGQVSAKVHSGSKATTVRVKAKITIDGKEIKTESRGLVISTGIADQNSFSISAETLNPEALNYDGVTSKIFVQAADHFNNPVPDGTAIYFTAEAGSVDPICLTDNGSCTVTWKSGGQRPTDGRVTILASMQGEESFVDSNGNGLLDDSEAFTDLPEIYRDDNKNGSFDGTDELNDYNENGQFDAANGEYNGLLCNPANTVNKCSVDKNVYVGDDIELVMSGSQAKFSNLPTVFEIPDGQDGSFTFNLTDMNDQPLPAGTTVDLNISIGEDTTGAQPFNVISEGHWVIENTNSNSTEETVVIKNEIYSKESSVLIITVTTPKGTVSRKYVTLVDKGSLQEPTNATKLSLSVDKAQMLPTGSVIITAVTKDDNNKVLTGIPVEFSVDKDGNIEPTGTNTAKLSPGSTPSGETLTVTARIKKDSGDIVKTVTVNVVDSLTVGLASSLEFTASSRQLFSAGVDPVVLSAIVKDKNNNTVKDETVVFSVDGNATITPLDNSGVVKTANLTPGSKRNRSLTVTATVGDIQKTIQVDVVGTKLDIEGPDSIAIDTPTEYRLKLLDSADKAIPFADVTVTTDLGTVTPAVGQTNANGELVINIESTTGGTAKITADSFGTQASKTIDISGNAFTLTGTDLNGDGNIDTQDKELNLGTPETITVKWFIDGNPAPDQAISVRTTRGTLSTDTVNLVAGEATFTVSSNTAGSATITAETASGLTTTLDREFVATTPAYLNSQAAPSLIAPNKSSTIITKVRDANDNPVKNVKVNFNLTDAVNGALSNSQAVTDSLGRAEVTYTAGDDSSAFEGVKIQTYLQDNTAITDNIALTVGGKALRIVLGEDETIAESDVFYIKKFGVIVTDSAGNPIKDQKVSFTITPTDYYKGVMYTVDTDGDGIADQWAQYISAFCPSEDIINKNGKLDAGEDDNGNGVLDPTHDAAVTGSGVTDDKGKILIEVIYPQSRALWSKQTITSSTTVNGTEYVENTNFVLPITADDVSDVEAGVPNATSPYGVSRSCSDSSGILTDEIVHRVVDAATGFVVSTLRKDTWYKVVFSGAHGQSIPAGSTYTVTSGDADLTVETGDNDSFRIIDGDAVEVNTGFKLTLDTVTPDGNTTEKLFFLDD